MFDIQASTYAGQATATGRDPRIMRAAREFESQLLGSLFSSLEKSFTSLDGDDQGTVLSAGAENYRAMGMRALADKLAASGGLGIARMITRDLASKQPAQSSNLALSMEEKTKVPGLLADRRIKARFRPESPAARYH